MNICFILSFILKKKINDTKKSKKNKIDLKNSQEEEEEEAEEEEEEEEEGKWGLENVFITKKQKKQKNQIVSFSFSFSFFSFSFSLLLFLFLCCHVSKTFWNRRSFSLRNGSFFIYSFTKIITSKGRSTTFFFG